MVLLVVLLALEVVFAWFVSWLIGKAVHLSPLPWWVCAIIVLLCNLFVGRADKKKRKQENGGEA